MLKRAHWPILMLTLALAGCGGGGGGGGTPAPTPGTGSTSNSNVTTIAPGAGPAGSTSSTATGQPISVSGFSYPQGIAVSGSTLYVANTSGQSISAIALNQPGYPFTSIPLKYSSGEPPLTQPTGLAISSDGTTLYVANWSGPVIAGQPGPGFIDSVDIATGNVTRLASGLNNPDGLALSADGNSLFVANHGKGDVLQISTTGGTTIATYYPASSASYPWSVYADSSSVYATNSNGTVSKWAIVPSGTPSSPPTTVATLASPAGITGANGYLYVADYQAEAINKIDLTSATPTVVATVSVYPRQPFFLAHDNTYLYFTDGNSGSVNAIPLP
ncbi:hypothetical protein [Thiomonas delicata]|uniref:SMP-30/Gluconolactonase/LRE-like region domain-containing protein n=1 Tax=Thiomonas delicata TaxID=364030 RepID=A0A238D0I2_THIDL|nr:hypothetical protein [Thiomonas delicata]SBP86776.1 exported hypothetical protein [Thiomonas delicata]